MAIDPGREVVVTVCSFDLAQAISVEVTAEPDDANLLLQDGWVLVKAGIDANGFPMFILAQPSDEWLPEGAS